MHYSQLFIPTLRDDPKDAETTSHKLLLRGGLIRQLVAGVYSFLPLGWKSMHKIMDIIREEMDAIGGQEMLMPSLSPIEIWEETGRDETMKDILLQLSDRKGHQFCLSPTHEEIITDIARGEVRSYKELPQIWYQMQNKFRDEARPRSGLLRVREFIMKDAYTLCKSWEELDELYEDQKEAYKRIFDRCGLSYYLVGASSGAMGGSGSQEFMVVSDAGEDFIAVCKECGYAANVEVAKAIPQEFDMVDIDKKEKVHTPDIRTVEEISEFLKLPEAQMLKTLLYMTPDDQPVMFMLRGDHQLSEEKINGLMGQIMRPAEPEEVKELIDADIGFIGPVGPLDNPEKIGNIKKYIDEAVPEDIKYATGACENDYHIKGYELSDIDSYERADIREVVKSDKCIECGKPIDLLVAIELGHIFKLGTKYSDSLSATFQDENSKQHPIIMGSYGIGVGRILSSAIELHADKDGIVFPITIAPYEVILTVLGDDEELVKASEKLYEDLKCEGVEVVIDDRPLRPGVKFSDADMIGIPIRITIGRRGLKSGSFELFDRKRKKSHDIDIVDAANEIIDYIEKLYDEVESGEFAKL
ncbi:MAG: proline--tRNA ligase [Candidatus Zixiibacteriota bacterium]